MFSKKDRPSRDGLPPDKRLKQGLVDLFASNVISGPKAQELLADSAASGAQACKDLAPSASSAAHGHSARDLKRKILRHNLWPSLYKADIPVWDQKQNRLAVSSMSFLLPHEVVHVLAHLGSTAQLAQVDGLD
eukprot:1470542-Lingulodinium_polyedra.AAC.1